MTSSLAKYNRISCSQTEMERITFAKFSIVHKLQLYKFHLADVIMRIGGYLPTKYG